MEIVAIGLFTGIAICACSASCSRIVARFHENSIIYPVSDVSQQQSWNYIEPPAQHFIHRDNMTPLNPQQIILIYNPPTEEKDVDSAYIGFLHPPDIKRGEVGQNT